MSAIDVKLNISFWNTYFKYKVMKITFPVTVKNQILKEHLAQKLKFPDYKITLLKNNVFFAE